MVSINLVESVHLNRSENDKFHCFAMDGAINPAPCFDFVFSDLTSS